MLLSHVTLLMVVVLGAVAPVGASPLKSFTVADASGLKALKIASSDGSAAVCMVAPSVQGDCEGLDTKGMQEQLGTTLGADTRMEAMGVVRFEEFPVLVMVTTAPHRAVDMSQEGIKEFEDGMRDAAAATHSRITLEPERRRVAGHEALWMELVTGEHGLELSCVNVVLFGMERMHSLKFIFPIGHSQEARRAMQGMLDSMDFTPGNLGRFGRPRDEIRGAAVGKVAVLLLPLLAIPVAFCVLVVYLLVRWRKAAKAA